MTCHYDQVKYTAATCLSGTVTNGLKAVIGNCVANTDIGATLLWKVTKCGPKDGFHFTVHASGDTSCATVSHTFAPSATGECAAADAASGGSVWMEFPYAVCAGSSCSAQFSSDSSATSLDVAATTTTTTTTTTATTTCPTTTTDTTDGAASVLVGAGAMAMSLAYL